MTYKEFVSLILGKLSDAKIAAKPCELTFKVVLGEKGSIRDVPKVIKEEKLTD